MSKSRVLFIVQGEGRGHMTQAIALKQLLENSNLELVGVMVGRSPIRDIPEFFKREINCDIVEFDSPNFLQDKNAQAIRVWRSIFYNLLLGGRFFRSIRRINSTVKKYKPDVIINFYEPLAGLYSFFYRPKTKVICIAHQYLYLHPDFVFPADASKGNINTVKNLTKITAIGAHKKLALSFYKVPAENLGNIKVVAPLLRKQVKEQPVSNGGYILVYLLNSGLMQNIINWHKNYPETEMHCFTDHESTSDEWKCNNKLTFHRLDDKKFIRLMAGAAGVVTTAGFETVCEAMYFGKPVLMVPVVKHFEQFCNSRDAYKAGAGVFDEAFKIEKLLDFIKDYKKDDSFRQWVDQSDATIINDLLN